MPLVLLHGGLAGRFAFSRQRGFAERFRLIIASSRGHDGTDGILPAEYGFDTTEVDDLTTVLSAEGVERAHLIGHSSGGATAFAFARKYPERVDRLVLIEPILLGLLHLTEYEAIQSTFLLVLETGRQGGPLAAVRGMLDWSGGESWRTLEEGTKIARLQSFAPMAHLVGPHARGLLALKVSEEDARAFRTPTLLIYGTASFEPHPAIEQRWRELRPDLQLIACDGAGHNVHRDKADVVNAAIDRFLRR